ncbi:MAG: DUF4062 domain-containing protein [Nitrospirae bacterium]|nr:DUF4062 domain-containing protein [Nitrospirota bacterium]
MKQRVIRVFVSSTFRDMHAEREELVKRVFPQLRKLCEQRGVTWGEVDLRWSGLSRKPIYGVKGAAMYAPAFQSARTKRRYKFGLYGAAFLDQIVAEGPIRYEFIIVVFEENATTPFLFVTSERSDPEADAELFRKLGIEPDMVPMGQGECYFLCMFDEQGHHNIGKSNDWSDAEKFEVAALKILTERLGKTPVITGG